MIILLKTNLLLAKPEQTIEIPFRPIEPYVSCHNATNFIQYVLYSGFQLLTIAVKMLNKYLQSIFFQSLVIEHQ